MQASKSLLFSLCKHLKLCHPPLQALKSLSLSKHLKPYSKQAPKSLVPLFLLYKHHLKLCPVKEHKVLSHASMQNLCPVQQPQALPHEITSSLAPHKHKKSCRVQAPKSLTVCKHINPFFVQAPPSLAPLPWYNHLKHILQN